MQRKTIVTRQLKKGNKILPCKVHIQINESGHIWIVAENKEGLTDYPIKDYSKDFGKRFLWDHPERYPDYVKYNLVPAAYDEMQEIIKSSLGRELEKFKRELENKSTEYWRTWEKLND